MAKNDIGGSNSVLLGFGVLVVTIGNDSLVIGNELFRRLPSQSCGIDEQLQGGGASSFIFFAHLTR
jgi:hypothetical protein